jgi:hypothetical protein
MRAHPSIHPSRAPRPTAYQVQLHAVPHHYLVTCAAVSAGPGVRRQVFYFDSFREFGACVPATPSEEPTPLQRQMAELYGPDIELIEAACPQQLGDSNACGAYASFFLWTLCCHGLQDGRRLLADMASQHGATSTAAERVARSQDLEGRLRTWLASCMEQTEADGAMHVEVWKNIPSGLTWKAPAPPKLWRSAGTGTGPGPSGPDVPLLSAVGTLKSPDQEAPVSATDPGLAAPVAIKSRFFRIRTEKYGLALVTEEQLDDLMAELSADPEPSGIDFLPDVDIAPPYEIHFLTGAGMYLLTRYFYA